jgi:hypothetical protein
MKHLGTVIGACIAGMFVMSVWGAFAGAYGIGGGWFAGLIIIGSMWFLNHFVGIINNDGAFVDQAVGIGVAGFMRVVFIEGAQAGIDSLPTLLVVCLGGLVGGITAAKLQQYLDSKASN